ncbi:hypothetical protein, partial [Acidisphaera rubrifaciens]|uniref:hypothetical protein n=1 Tax=Acidisphaera rubrifaciens TaxID=50715 RepID=UPI000662AB1C
MRRASLLIAALLLAAPGARAAGTDQPAPDTPGHTTSELGSTHHSHHHTHHHAADKTSRDEHRHATDHHA